MLQSMTASRLLLWCLAGGALAQFILSRAGSGNPFEFSPAFWYLLTAYDAHGNFLLGLLAIGAFALRKHPAALAMIRYASDRPWSVAAAMFVLLCVGSVGVYHQHPLSMDEYSPLFQAKAFAAGRLSGQLPPELLDRLVPSYFQTYFFSASRESGEISTRYWPGFALLMTPFAWVGMPWILNPAIGALTLPALHRLVLQATDSREAAGWAIAFTAASPAFVLSSISFYSMPAHLLCNLLYALLLLRPTEQRAIFAGAIGSVALVLHQPAPHLLFCLPFFAWLVMRGSWRMLACLVAGYLPLGLLLGVGWYAHVIELARPAMVAATPAPGAVESLGRTAAGSLVFPSRTIMEARLAGLSKIWTWGACGLPVLAAWGGWRLRGHTDVRLLAAAFLFTFFGYFLVAADQGHGWGYRYIHSAWFVLPVLAAMALAATKDQDLGLRQTVAWATALSLIALNGLRLVQTESYVARSLAQVPPLAYAPAQRDVIFVDARASIYARDLVQNDPFLRGLRVVMVSAGPASDAALMAQRFPGFKKNSDGAWGSAWRASP
jgi:hypothetical protein